MSFDQQREGLDRGNPLPRTRQGTGTVKHGGPIIDDPRGKITPEPARCRPADTGVFPGCDIVAPAGSPQAP